MQLRITVPALADLDDAYDYLSREATQETAEKQADAFNALFRRLLTFPYSGRSAEQYRLGLREAHTKRYRVFYSVRPDAVEIVRVLHGARNVGPEMF